MSFDARLQRTSETSGIFETSWTWWPEDTLDALDLMLLYFGVHDQLVITPEITTIRKDSNIKCRLHRAIHDKALRSAVRLIKPGTKSSKLRRSICWYVNPTFDTKGRLAGAGIDINTLNIIDHRRWAFAWQQLTTGNKIIYSAAENDILNASSHETPPVEPIYKRVITHYTKGRPAKIAFAFKKKNNFVWENGKRIYSPRQAEVRDEQLNRKQDGPQL